MTLAEIPFVRLREGQPDALLAGRARFSGVVVALNRVLGPPWLEIDVDTEHVRAGDCPVPMPPADLAFLLWFARRARRGYPAWAARPRACPKPDYARDYLAAYDRLRGRTTAIDRRYRDGMSTRDFDERRTKVNTALRRRSARATRRRT